MNIFEEASRKKLRFETRLGTLNVEDLWDLPLTSETKVNLDSLAIGLNGKLKEYRAESFVRTTNPLIKVLELKFNIVKYIIDTKLNELKEREKAVARESRRQELLEIKSKKMQEIDYGKSLEEIDRELADLADLT